MANQAPTMQNVSEIFAQFRQELKEIQHDVVSLFSEFLSVKKSEREDETVPYPETELQSGDFKMVDKVESPEFVMGRGDLQIALLKNLIFVVDTPLETFFWKTNVIGSYWVFNGLPILLELFLLILNPKTDRSCWGGEVLLILRNWRRRKKRKEEER